MNQRYSGAPFEKMASRNEFYEQQDNNTNNNIEKQDKKEFRF
ncbi:MAG: hypothetical protein AAF549_07115 [Pseudomonadota bacterium]